jgi:hypothetical protein
MSYVIVCDWPWISTFAPLEERKGVAVLIDVADLARNVFVEVLTGYRSGGKPVPDPRFYGIPRTEDCAIAVNPVADATAKFELCENRRRCRERAE